MKLKTSHELTSLGMECHSFHWWSCSRALIKSITVSGNPRNVFPTFFPTKTRRNITRKLLYRFSPLFCFYFDFKWLQQTSENDDGWLSRQRAKTLFLQKTKKKSVLYILLIWQVSPVHPGGQEQLNDPPTSSVKQVPPCWQGAVAHTLSTTSQLEPEKPSGQTHRYSLGFLLTHVAPFWHTCRLPQGFKSLQQKNESNN